MRGARLLAIALTVIALTACNAASERNGDTLTVAVSPTEDVKRFQDEMNQKIDALETRIASAREELRDQSAEARAKSEEGINSMEREVRDLRARVREAKYETKEGWDRFTSEVGNALERLGKSIDESVH